MSKHDPRQIAGPIPLNHNERIGLEAIHRG